MSNQEGVKGAACSYLSSFERASDDYANDMAGIDRVKKSVEKRDADGIFAETPQDRFRSVVGTAHGCELHQGPADCRENCISGVLGSGICFVPGNLQLAAELRLEIL